MKIYSVNSVYIGELKVHDPKVKEWMERAKKSQDAILKKYKETK